MQWRCMLVNVHVCTMHKPHGRMRTLSAQCTSHMEGCAPWVHSVHTVSLQHPLAVSSGPRAPEVLTRPLHQRIYCAIQNTGAECSTGDAGRVSALQGCMHMGNSYIQWFHSFIHTCMHIYVIATCKTQLQHCKLDCLLVSVCSNFSQY